MAVRSYGYDPSDIPNTIADDLSGLGLECSDQTVRKKLKEARGFFPGNWKTRGDGKPNWHSRFLSGLRRRLIRFCVLRHDAAEFEDVASGWFPENRVWSAQTNTGARWSDTGLQIHMVGGR